MKLSYKHLTVNIPLPLLRWLKGRMRYVRAAGGMVATADGRRLLIFRNGRWDLPKGKVEAGESLGTAALREVEEETGVKATLAARRPVKTYHLYNLYGGWHLKQTAWFPMEAEACALLPQEEEGITGGEWVDTPIWHRRLGRSYGTLRTLEKQARHTPKP
ncbi:MAG: NUDIX domain-containing protein [Bacteroidales bacterium]|nr:NUDIX domain-containing protein [Bacteroidales bacterium]